MFLCYVDSIADIASARLNHRSGSIIEAPAPARSRETQGRHRRLLHHGCTDRDDQSRTPLPIVSSNGGDGQQLHFDHFELTHQQQMDFANTVEVYHPHSTPSYQMPISSIYTPYASSSSPSPYASPFSSSSSLSSNTQAPFSSSHPWTPIGTSDADSGPSSFNPSPWTIPGMASHPSMVEVIPYALGSGLATTIGGRLPAVYDEEAGLPYYTSGPNSSYPQTQFQFDAPCSQSEFSFSQPGTSFYSDYGYSVGTTPASTTPEPVIFEFNHPTTQSDLSNLGDFDWDTYASA